jgi:hypothetical protein
MTFKLENRTKRVNGCDAMRPVLSDLVAGID